MIKKTLLLFSVAFISGTTLYAQTTEEETPDMQLVEEVEMPVFESADEQLIYTVVEDQPKPAGGYEAFHKWVKSELKYPAEAAENRIKGRVYVQFVIDEEGEATDIKVVRGLGYGCDEEAMRVIDIMPAWTPGKQRGEVVKVRMIMPLIFEKPEKK